MCVPPFSAVLYYLGRFGVQNHSSVRKSTLSMGAALVRKVWAPELHKTVLLLLESYCYSQSPVVSFAGVEDWNDDTLQQMVRFIQSNRAEHYRLSVFGVRLISRYIATVMNLLALVSFLFPLCDHPVPPQYVHIAAVTFLSGIVKQ